MPDVFFYIFIAIVVIQLVYYLGIFTKFAFANPQQVTPKKIPVSVLIWTKNEAEKLKTLIPLLSVQDYPDYELIFINDASVDETKDILEEAELAYSNIRAVNVENNEAFWGNKKFALTLGIKAARKEYLLFTNADCMPATGDWITQMASHFTLSKTIVIGHTAYEKVKKSFFNKIVRYDNTLSAMQGFSWAKAGRPYKAKGSNLAYKKEEFFKVNGFVDHMNIRLGEDSLFINQAATATNTTISYNPESFVLAQPPATVNDFIVKKRKELYTASYFAAFNKNQLYLFGFTQLAFILLAVILAAIQYNWMFLVPVIAVRYIATWIITGYTAAKLEEKDVIIWYPVFEIIIIFLQLHIYIKNSFSKTPHWK